MQYVQMTADRGTLSFPAAGAGGAQQETLLQVITEPVSGAVSAKIAGNEPVALTSWDTVAVSPGEDVTLELAEGATAKVLMVSAA